MGASEEGMQDHHLIPDNVVQKHPITKEALKREKTLGWHLDNKENLIRLPSTEETKKKYPDRPMHSGSHSEWDKMVISRLDARLALLISKFGQIEDVPDPQLISAINTVESYLMGIVKTWSRMH